MGRNRFVNPTETVTLNLSDGDYIVIKRRLTAADDREWKMASFGRLVMGDGDERQVNIDWAHQDIVRAAIWIVEWSFQDDRGRRVEPSREAIKNLDPDTLDEITKAIDAYVEEQARLRQSDPTETPSEPALTLSSPSAER